MKSETFFKTKRLRLLPAIRGPALTCVLVPFGKRKKIIAPLGIKSQLPCTDLSTVDTQSSHSELKPTEIRILLGKCSSLRE